ncbi:MAG: chemotaxis-specific protein-glutamate methyltransferase CheB [Kineosporiaceae bacterium]
MTAGRLRIAVVDDSVVVRRLVADTLRSDPRIGEVRTATNGREGVTLVREMRPDLVTMDIEMPVLDGIAALRELRRFDPRVPVIMFSTLTEAGAKATLDAFAAGATEFVTKPAQAHSLAASLETIRRDLIGKVVALTTPPTATGPVPLSMAPSGRPTSAQWPRAAGRGGVPVPRPVPSGPPRLVAIGSSTGGPEALGRVLAALPGDLAVPVVVTQHMPAMFTRMLAHRLDAGAALRVREATDGDVLEPGTVTIAPGGRHLVVLRSGAALTARLTDDPPVHSCRPSVDVLFRSLPAAVGSAALVVVLTGMGADGAEGAARVAAAGGRVWVQDQATSVVWGMPGAVVAATAVEEVLPLDGVSPAIVRAVGRPGGRGASPTRLPLERQVAR